MGATNKQDWLNDFFSLQAGMLVSGHPSFSEAVGLHSSDQVVLRFIGNRIKIHCLILTIASNNNEWPRVKLVLLAEKAQAVLQSIKNCFPFVLVSLIYDPQQNNAFSLLQGSSFINLDESELSSFFKEMSTDLTENIGATKDINKTINDSFQTWTRKCLSKFIVVNDFDSLSTTQRIVFEFKRVKESIENWIPYLDDAANYATLLILCKNSEKVNSEKVKLRIISYNVEKNDLISLHTISNAAKDVIEGRYILCRPKDVINSIVGISYKSQKRRSM